MQKEEKIIYGAFIFTTITIIVVIVYLKYHGL